MFQVGNALMLNMPCTRAPSKALGIFNVTTNSSRLICLIIIMHANLRNANLLLLQVCQVADDTAISNKYARA